MIESDSGDVCRCQSCLSESGAQVSRAPDFLTRQKKWDRRFLRLARFFAQESSKDPSTQTGAVIARPDNTVASLGYNGFPRGCNDDPALYADRETKYSRIVHCEMNAIISAREPLHGYTLYTWPFASCDRCAAHVIQAGITRAVAPVLPESLKERWAASLMKTEAVFGEAGVQMTLVDLGDAA